MAIDIRRLITNVRFLSWGIGSCFLLLAQSGEFSGERVGDSWNRRGFSPCPGRARHQQVPLVGSRRIDGLADVDANAKVLRRRLLAVRIAKLSHHHPDSRTVTAALQFPRRTGWTQRESSYKIGCLTEAFGGLR